MKKSLLIIFGIIPLLSFGQLLEKIDKYVTDTTTDKWAIKFNAAIYGYTGSTDTIKTRGHVNETAYYQWDILVNRFIDSVGCDGCDTINSTVDHIEDKRLKFNLAIDSAITFDYFELSNGSGFTHTTTLKGTSGDSILLDWGDNSDTLLVFNGSDQIVTHDYLAGTYQQVIRINNPLIINKIAAPNQSIINEIPLVIQKMRNLEFLQLNDNALTTNLSQNNWVGAMNNWTNMSILYMDDNSLTGDITGAFSTWESLTQIQIHNNSLSGDLETAFQAWGNVTTCYLYANNFSGHWGVEMRNMTSATDVRVYSNINLIGVGYAPTTTLSNYSASLSGIIQSSVDSLFSDFANYYAIEENTPTRNLNVFITGGNNQAPTCGDDNPDINRLQQIYDDAGYTFTYAITAGGVCDLQQQPLMIMPDTVYLIANESYEIYDDAIAGQNIQDKNINIEYTCNVGSKSYYGYEFSETLDDTGYYDFKAVALEGSTRVDSAECVLRLISRGNGTGTKQFNFIGNSLLSRSIFTYMDSVRTGLTGITAEMNGSLYVDPYKNEGRGGWTYNLFLNSAESPMYIGGSYNYSLYRQDTLELINPVDFASTQLGINDIFTTDSSFIENTLIPQMKRFVDSMLTDGTENVIICMPPICESTTHAWDSIRVISGENQNDYIHRMHILWYRIVENFSGGRYASNVYVSPQGMFLDRNNGYPKNSQGEHTDDIHPNDYGYYQLSDVQRALIEGILKEN